MSNVFLMLQKSLFPLTIIVVANSFSGCSSPDATKAQSLKDTTNASASTYNPSAVQASDVITGQLKILYIETDTLKTFIRSNPGKAVFQFLIDNDGALTLALFKGNKNHKNFDQQKLVLKVSGDDADGQVITKNVFLGDQEISRKTDADGGAFKDIKDTVDKYKPEFIIFTPHITTVGQNKTDTIKYEIGCLISGNKNALGILSAVDLTSIQTTGISLNPSPPRNGGY